MLVVLEYLVMFVLVFFLNIFEKKCVWKIVYFIYVNEIMNFEIIELRYLRCFEKSVCIFVICCFLKLIFKLKMLDVRCILRKFCCDIYLGVIVFIIGSLDVF